VAATSWFPRAVPVLFLAAAGLAASARAAEGLEGTWDTPLGRVRIDQAQGGYLGRLLENAPVCRFLRGEEVLRGKILDDVFAGELRVCYPEACGLPEGWLLALAARVEDGARLVGAAAGGSGCPNRVYKGQPFAFLRRAEPDRVSPGGPRRGGVQASAQALFNEGRAFAAAGNWERARRSLERAERIDPGNPLILNLIGITYYGRNEIEEAQRYYLWAIKRDPTFVDAHYNLACALARQGRSRGALTSLRRAVDLGFAAAGSLEADPDLASIRAEPAYLESLRIARANAARAR
jgi:hypothetical protein